MALPPIANLIVHYKMNDNAANSVLTDNRGANNGVWTEGGATPRYTNNDSTTGKINEALQTSNGGSSLGWGNCGNPACLLLTTGTVTCWVKTTDGINYRGLAVRPHSYGLVMTTNKFSARDSTTSTNYYGTNTINDGNWHFGAFVFQDGVVNGSFIRTDASNSAAFTWNIFSNTNYPFCIGNYAASYFPGTVDDVRVYDIALSDEQLNAIYNNGDGTESETSVATTVPIPGRVI